ncbi:virulence RhuM family protein [Aeromonas veronii]|nr:virulence RhuM family protein [Aeromonas veronii]
MSDTAQQIAIFEGESGEINVTLQQETVWLTQAQLAQLFAKNKRTISEHIRNLFKEGELEESAVVRNFRTTASDGKSYDTQHYNLDVIISVGYRVKSPQGVRFRQWATRQTPATNNMTQTTALRVTHPTQGKDAQRGAA